MDQKKDFFKDVYQVVELIPEGRVTSYGAIAKYLGAARSSRVVGWALNSSFSSPVKIPAHRVVNRLGILSGKMHFPTPAEMEEALVAEGHEIINDQIMDFKTAFWDPAIELEL